MATTQLLQTFTLPVALATVIRQFRFVVVNSSGEAAEAGAGAAAVGVSQLASTATSSKAIPVAAMNGGIIKVEAGGTVAAGARVESDSQGRAITAGGNTDRALGTAVDAGSSGSVIAIVAGVSGFAAN